MNVDYGNFWYNIESYSRIFFFYHSFVCSFIRQNQFSEIDLKQRVSIRAHFKIRLCCSNKYSSVKITFWSNYWNKGYYYLSKRFFEGEGLDKYRSFIDRRLKRTISNLLKDNIDFVACHAERKVKSLKRHYCQSHCKTYTIKLYKCLAWSLNKMLFLAFSLFNFLIKSYVWITKMNTHSCPTDIISILIRVKPNWIILLNSLHLYSVLRSICQFYETSMLFKFLSSSCIWHFLKFHSSFTVRNVRKFIDIQEILISNIITSWMHTAITAVPKCICT